MIPWAKISAIGAAILTGILAALKLISIGKKQAHSEVMAQQHKVEKQAADALATEKKTGAKRVKNVQDKIDKSDFSSLNDN